MAKWKLWDVPPSEVDYEDPMLPQVKPGPATVVDGYEPLAMVLRAALDQAQHGKGKDRHANGKPFDRQPILEIGRMVGQGYPLGQAMKKAQESMRLPPDRAKAELLGAINYLAAAYLLLDDTP
jgi:hypothetical protein